MAQRIALITVVLCTAMHVGTAQADWQLDRAQTIAAKVWNDPCSGQVKILSAVPPQAGWRAWTYPGLCTITLSNAWPWYWDELCPVVVHEYGHLAGYRDPDNPADPTHSHDPNDIMSPFVHAYPKCDDYGTVFLGFAPPGISRVGIALPQDVSSPRAKPVKVKATRRCPKTRKGRKQRGRVTACAAGKGQARG